MLKLPMLSLSPHMALVYRRVQNFCTFADVELRPSRDRIQLDV